MSAKEMRELRATIRVLSGRPARQGATLEHLRKRAAMLSAKRDAELTFVYKLVEMRHIEMLGDGRAGIVAKLASMQRLTADAVIDRAVDEYAVRNGLGGDVERAKRVRR